MDRWKFVNEKWIPRPVSRGEGFVSGIAVLSYRSLPHYYENISRLKNGAKSSPSITFLLKTYENYVAA